MQKKSAFSQLIETVIEFDDKVIEGQHIQSKPRRIQHPVRKRIIREAFILYIARIGIYFGEDPERHLVV